MIRVVYRRRWRAPRPHVLFAALSIPLLLSLAPAPSDRLAAAEAVTDAATPSVGGLLVARRGLPDPNFFEAVVLLLAYDREVGAAGVVINRRSEVSVAEAVAYNGLFGERDDALYLGGPVAVETLSVLLLGDEAPGGSSPIVGNVSLVHDREGLELLIEAEAPAESLRFYAGYAGWSPGQLEDEIFRGVWHVVEGDSRWVFSADPEDAWNDLIRIFFGPRA